VTDERVESLMRKGRKNSDRYRTLKANGLSENEIIATFEVPTPMRVFSWEGEFDTIMTPNDSIKYYKNLLRAGLLSIDPNTGFVKAWVGGTDFKHFAYDQVKLGKRQVGSTIKPFVYATALLMGVVKPCTKFTEGTSFCVDIYGGNGELAKRWCPRGDIPKNASVASGLAISSNPITVAVMSKMGGYAGPKTISKVLRDMDINMRAEDEVPSMCLGIMDLSLFEMVGAQAMFVNQGIYTRPTTIMRIEDRNGNVIYSAEPYSKEVLNAYDAYTTLTMMKGVVTAGTSTSLRWHPKWGGLEYPIAGKTGTTQNNSDGWFMGLTPDLVTGVWIGAEDRDVRFRSMTWGQGARMALPIWGYYMQKAYKDKTLNLSKEDFEVPIGYDPEQYNCDDDRPIEVPNWGI
jgi:penicillin-binding protein 1A